MADHRRLLERALEVVQQRIEQAEELGLQKLEEAEREGRRRFEEAQRRSHRKRQKAERRLEREEHRARRRARRLRRAAEAIPPLPPTPPVPPTPGRSRSRKKKRSPEEIRYREARKRANRRLGLYAHAVVYASILTMLLVTTRSFRAVFIVAICWGIGLFLHYFWTLLAPQLRERWIEREVGERVDENVSSERARVEHDAVRSLENLSASIAHEIRNPITAAKSLVQQLGEDPGSRDNIEYASVALEELDRVERSISHLLRYAREEELELVDLEMAEVIRSALETFRDRIARSGVEIDLQLDTRGTMRGDPEKLRRVVINLISNALDAMEAAATSRPRIAIMSGDNLAGSEVWIRVQDNGPGIDGETRARIFDPFYTTKETGTGLGLALSKKVVEAHGGTLSLESSPEHGTEFVLAFPKRARSRGDVR